MDADAPSDRDLMRQLAAGRREALVPLIERYQRRVYHIALRYLRSPDEALDATQETFVKAFEHAGRWEPTAEVGPWLTRIAVNQSIDQYRREKRRRQHEEPLATIEGEGPVPSDVGPSPERRLFGREIGERVDRAVRSLPDQQRAIFTLRHYEGLTLEEIAETLELNLGTVKSGLHRAIHRLRDRLQGLAT